MTVTVLTQELCVKDATGQAWGFGRKGGSSEVSEWKAIAGYPFPFLARPARQGTVHSLSFLEACGTKP